ncbi:MAG TPA: hypothetical protein PLW95_02820 [bacterium]|nr:hypothetical protein [bacterium]
MRGKIIGLRDKVDSITNIEKVKERMERIESRDNIEEQFTEKKKGKI